MIIEGNSLVIASVGYYGHTLSASSTRQSIIFQEVPCAQRDQPHSDRFTCSSSKIGVKLLETRKTLLACLQTNKLFNS
jgi:hypothetical protein